MLAVSRFAILAVRVVAVGLVLFPALVKGEKQDAKLVDCDLGKAVTFEKTRSPDGRFVVAWSLQKLRKDAPDVDWALWEKGTDYRFGLIEDAAESPEDGAGKPYLLANWLIDTKTGKSLHLPTDWPDFTGKNRGYIVAAWKQGDNDLNYALIENDARFSTNDLWLIKIQGGQMRRSALAADFKRAIAKTLVLKSPVQADRYGVFFSIDRDPEDLSSKGAIFSRDTVTIPFTAEIPKSLNVPDICGDVLVALPTEKVMSVRCDTAVDDPFFTSPPLRQADQHLNVIYQRLVRRLDEKQASVLRREEQQWIETRNHNASDAVHDAEGEEGVDWKAVRDAVLLEETKKRAVQLTRQLNAK